MLVDHPPNPFAGNSYHLYRHSIVKTTGEAGGLIGPYKGLLPASAIRALKT